MEFKTISEYPMYDISKNGMKHAFRTGLINNTGEKNGTY